ncbi:MAG: hypothetical protein MRJ68_02475 [Nitrospira sp.]|nr:hypothetical protein [Nitrospira sp.]
MGWSSALAAPEAAHDLADILYEKGQITKEVAQGPKTDSEKAEEEQRKARDSEFPISIRYKDGFDIQTQDGKFEMLIQNRLQFRYAFPQDSDSVRASNPAAFDNHDVSSFHALGVPHPGPEGTVLCPGSSTTSSTIG